MGKHGCKHVRPGRQYELVAPKSTISTDQGNVGETAAVRTERGNASQIVTQRRGAQFNLMFDFAAGRVFSTGLSVGIIDFQVTYDRKLVAR